MMRIDSKDMAYINEQAKKLNVKPNALLAIIEVESAGVVGSPNPVIRWEGHYFDRLVPAKLRATARAQGLAAPSAGVIKNTNSQSGRYAILERAMRIDKEAALSSISIGVGQVMGSHWKILGYPSAEAMFNRAKEGFAGQVELMIRYIVVHNLVDEIQRLDWSAFSRGYNGKNYAKHGYHTNIAAAFRRYEGGSPVTTTPASVGMLRMGSKGARVRELQQLLVRAGFAVGVDGDFGPATKEAVMSFQRAHSLEADGVVGPQTQAKLVEMKVEPDEKVAVPKPTEIPEVKTGINVALGGGLIFMLQQFFASWMDKPVILIAIAVIAIGALWAVNGYQKSKLTYEGVS